MVRLSGGKSYIGNLSTACKTKKGSGFAIGKAAPFFNHIRLENAFGK